DGDVRLLQPADEALVRRPVDAGRGVDAGDPQAAEVALLEAAADVAVLPGVADDLDGPAEAGLSSAAETPGLVEDAVAATARLETTLDTGHFRAPSSAVGEHELDALLERLLDHVVLAKATAVLLALLLHDVVEARLAATHAARPGDLEPLRGGP